MQPPLFNRKPMMPVALMALTVVLARIVMSIGHPFSIDRLCGDLAIVAAAVAASERRTVAMLAATALAAGLAWPGAIALCFGIGVAVQRRVPARVLPIACAAGLLGIVCASARTLPTLPIAEIGLWAIAPLRPDGAQPLTGLFIATALGGAAWYIAQLTVRPVAGTVAIAAMVAGLTGFALITPMGSDSLIAPLALAIALPDRRSAALIAIAMACAKSGHPVPATLCLVGTLWLTAHPFRRRAANDNGVFRARYTRAPLAC